MLIGPGARHGASASLPEAMRTTPAAAELVSAPWRNGREPGETSDGWLGTPEHPGYRAGRIVVRLADVPHIAPGHLYLDVLLLDAAGRTQEAASGVCSSLSCSAPNDERSRFVCVSAELLRHAGNEAGRFSAIAAAVGMLREQGVSRSVLMSAARLLDLACSEATLVNSLADVLERCLGQEDARDSVAEVLARLVRTHVIGVPMAVPESANLTDLLHLLVHGLGKHRARHVLRMGTDFDLVPALEMYPG